MSARIAIDARKLADYGIGSYLRGLLGGLAELGRDDRYLLLAPAGARAVAAALPGNFEWIEEGSPLHSWRELTAVTGQARRLGADLLHCPHYVVPLAPPCPIVVTLHDTIQLDFPEALPRPRALAYGYARVMHSRATRIAARVIAVSEAAAVELADRLRPARGKLVVIPNGVDPRFRAGPATPPPATGHLLFVGNPKPHKNLPRLIEAYARLARERPARGRALPPLVVAGGDRRGETAPIAALAARLGVAERVRFAGFVDDEELAALYRDASMLVFPTLAEGFGLPIAEAMASGRPAVVSNRPVHREVAGAAGELVDPLDPASIAAGIARLLDDTELAARRGAAGRRLAERFQWRRAAELTAAAYDAALAARRSA